MWKDDPDEPGYYWVRFEGGDWTVARYKPKLHGIKCLDDYPFSVVGSDDNYAMRHFQGPWLRISEPEIPAARTP